MADQQTMSLFPDAPVPEKKDTVPEPWPQFDDDDGVCNTCDGSGTIVTCCDDICHGQGYCMHGDGEQLCPECGGRW